MVEPLNRGKITQSQFTEDYISSLLVHTFETARKYIKANQDETGERRQRIEASKDRNKRKERRREMSCSYMRYAAWYTTTKCLWIVS